jgi:hypothetical protein
VKKSSARIAFAWDRRNSAQPGASRRGAGSIPASLRISHTVYDAKPGKLTVDPPVPHDSFSRASRCTTDRTLRCTGGRPERRRRDNRAHRADNVAAPVQIVAGVTISRHPAKCPAGSVLASKASHARSGHVNRE